jgi:hypothetical protein
MAISPKASSVLRIVAWVWLALQSCGHGFAKCPNHFTNPRYDLTNARSRFAKRGKYGTLLWISGRSKRVCWPTFWGRNLLKAETGPAWAGFRFARQLTTGNWKIENGEIENGKW